MIALAGMNFRDLMDSLKLSDIRPLSLLEKQKQAYQEDVTRYQSLMDNFVKRDCPGCRSTTTHPFCLHLNFQFDRCPACFSIFMNPGPTETMIQEFYKNSSNYKFWAEEMYPQTKETRKSTLHLDRARFALSFTIEQNKARKLRILEVGAGTGDSMVVLRELLTGQECDFFALEPNPDMWPALTMNRIQRIADVGEVSQGGFDLILAYEVLEHVLNPREFLKVYSSHLNPGGTFILSTPNANSLEVQLLKEESTTLDIEHISVLTPAAIHGLAAASGLNVVEISTPGKFDVQLLRNSSKLNHETLGRIIFDDEVAQHFINELKVSSHMKIALRK